jgi:hypothetical protein
MNTMQQVLNTNIKDVITRFPDVGAILGTFEIGCVTCHAGTCLLKDVVGIHGLTEDKEAELFRQIAAAIFPGQRAPAIPRSERKAVSQAVKAPHFSPPMQELVDEHVESKIKT